MMKIPKWQTDPIWALRRAKKRKEKLPEEVEELFIGKPDYCLSYFKDTIKTLGENKLPDFLIDSVCDHYRAEFASPINNSPRLNVSRKAAASWVVSYAAFGGQINDKINDLFIESVSQHMNSHYDWGRSKVLKLAEILNYEINKNLENLIWNFSDCAVDYATKSKKRMPPEIEEKNLLEVDEDNFIEYVQSIFNGRAPENIELLLIKMPSAACQYAKNIIKGKLPEAIHSSLIMQTFGDADYTIKEPVVEYLNFIEKIKIYAIRILEEFDECDTVGSVLKKIR